MDNSTAKLNVVRTDVEPCHLKLDIEIAPERVEQIREKIVGEFHRSAKVPGFRPGKAPRKLLLSRYKEPIEKELKARLLEQGVKDAVEQEGIEPETTPRVENEDAVTCVEGEPFVFAVAFDVAPDFTLPDYKNIKVSRDVAPVEDSSVEEVIGNWLQHRTSYETVERPAADGDLLKVTYKATLPDDLADLPENVGFMVEAEETWLSLKEPTLLPGVLPGLIGVEAGSSKELSIDFPEEYAVESLAGRSLSYRFEIHEVQAASVPELTDELAREVGAENADDVRERVRKNLAAEKERADAQALRDQVVAALMADMDFPLPPSLLRREVYDTLTRLYETELRNGAARENIQERQKELMERADVTARRNMRQYYVLTKIADAENIEVTPDELNATVEVISRSQGITPKVMLRRLRDSGRLGGLFVSLRESKTIDHLVSLADITETTPEKE